MAQEVTVGVGGAAGDGIDKTGDTFARAYARLGLHMYAYNSYQSVIRGGHIWLRIRAAEEKVYSPGDQLNAMIALNQDTIDQHAAEVNEHGVIIYNGDKLHVDESVFKPGVRAVPIPIKDLMKTVADRYGVRLDTVMQNTVLLGALIWLLQLDLETLNKMYEEIFARKGQAVISQNVDLALAGYEYAKANHPAMDYRWTYSRKSRPVLTGNETIGIGALMAGCRFYSAYPMTPASSLLHFMASHAAEYGVCVKQAEDELAVVNMAIGAGHVGVRAMCGTSGGGYALMTEAIGMAGMAEVPVVILEVQRGGPSTGLPTKTEQGDLNQVFGASQGEYPRMIVAPADLVDTYNTTVEAFQMAEKYQLPVTIISDLLLSEHNETADPEAFDFNVTIDRGELAEPNENGNGEYKRYLVTESGISPRSLPGDAGNMFVGASDEHDERSILISDVYTDPLMRIKMMQKRMRKLEGLLRNLPAPTLHGPADADITFISWGSTQGVIWDAIALLAQEGIKTNNLQIKYLVPFHTDEVATILNSCKLKVLVEQNFTGQLGRHIRAETGISPDATILKYDGEPMEPLYIVNHVKEILNGTSRNGR
ncbi:MAG: 2-oxoacid:acceptor oxidoreductase subunit alpha [Candidatus Latescibacteria bacterium]|nr:2-oxoacid:acceptor oxidoreductase subunit alpha [Candidatus Latescibacterota bacterium]